MSPALEVRSLNRWTAYQGGPLTGFLFPKKNTFRDTTWSLNQLVCCRLLNLYFILFFIVTGFKEDTGDLNQFWLPW